MKSKTPKSLLSSNHFKVYSALDKRQRLAQCTQKCDPFIHTVATTDSLYFQRHKRIQSERLEKIAHANNNQKSRVAVLKLENKKFVRNKE